MSLPSLKMLALGALVICALFFGVQKLRRSLASDEDLIRWRLEEMAAGFNDATLAPALRGFARTFRDESSGATRDDVKSALVHLFFTEKVPETKAFRLRVELPVDELVIVTEGDPPRATLELEAVFYAKVPAGEELYWDAALTAEFEKGERGWQIVRTRDVNHGDRVGGR